MKTNDSPSFDVIFEKLKEYAGEQPPALEQLQDAGQEELEEIRVLREIVSETLEPPAIYFTRT